MKRIINIIFGICILVIFSGCATVFTGTSQQMSITSEPAGANVMIYNRNNNQLVNNIQTPAIVRLPKNKSYRFVVEKEGYQQIRKELKSELNPWFLASLGLGTLYTVQAFTPPPNIELTPGEPMYSQESWTGFSLLWAAVMVIPDLITGNYRKYSSREHFLLTRTNNLELQPNRPVTPTTLHTQPTSDVGIAGAVERAVNVALRNVLANKRIAIIPISSQDRTMRDYVTGELEFLAVNNGFRIVDRVQLDRIREEQELQISWEVDERTAVSIGKFAGADYIITGQIDGTGDLRRLRLRVLDTQTAELIGVAAEPF